ncbi:hypothetical protein [Williamsia sp. CHRR-6]|uniref:hypothetical protein n=1 Tax=Williamsia sp. CHRR-6 TaxID=2835871 RepID=UPI001BDA0C20|nr:hypothetical protein [Williamsia sp. CHRR-6]MBT0566053.1 hypothetical protein [Williamsia sp. CHRR-6]
MTTDGRGTWFGPASIPCAAFSFGLITLATITDLGNLGVILLLNLAILALALSYFRGRPRHAGIGLFAGFATLPIGSAAYLAVIAIAQLIS